MTFASPARIDGTPAGNATPIFLHTGWRSRGTWIWTALRADPRVMGLYEPLHEAMAGLTPEGIATSRPDSWFSGHPAMAPYWSEFAGMLRPDAPGVPGYHAAFATENAFAGATETAPELAAYLGGLLRHAAAAGRVPVVKFCRSMGRVAWMRATFPQALHAVVLRRPDAQWASALRQMEVRDNPYFVAMPLLALARNADAPVVARACRALRVPLPRLRQADPARAAETCRQMVDHLSWADRYGAFLAHWMAGALSALATDCLVMDADMLLWSAQYRRDMAAAVARRSGLPLNLPIDPVRTVTTPAALDGEEAEAQRAALTLLQEHRAALRPGGYMMAWNLLAAPLVRSEAEAHHDDAAEAEDPSALSPPRPWFRNPWARRRHAAAE